MHVKEACRLYAERHGLDVIKLYAAVTVFHGLLQRKAQYEIGVVFGPGLFVYRERGHISRDISGGALVQLFENFELRMFVELLSQTPRAGGPPLLGTDIVWLDFTNEPELQVARVSAEEIASCDEDLRAIERLVS